jgi:hypothetical protein
MYGKSVEWFATTAIDAFLSALEETVEAPEPVAFIVEKRDGTNRVVFLREKYDPRKPSFWLNDEARQQYIVTELVPRAALAALQARVEQAERERDEAKDEAVNFVFDHLATALGLAVWVGEDGSETWDGDVCATLMRILRDSRAIDPETDTLACDAVEAAEARAEALQAKLDKYVEALSEGLDLCARARKMASMEHEMADTYLRNPDMTRSATIPLWAEEQYQRDLAAWEAKSKALMPHPFRARALSNAEGAGDA